MRILEKVKAQLEFSNVFVDDKIAKISIVGAGMIDRPGIAAQMFKTLADSGINIKMILNQIIPFFFRYDVITLFRYVSL